MISFTQEQTLWGQLSGDSSPASKALGAILCNESRKQILSSRRWKFSEKEKTLSTVASQQSYDLPSDFLYLNGISITIGTTQYNPIEIKSLDQWGRITQSTAVESDIPQYFFIFANTLSFFPTPSSSTTNAITFTYGRRAKDLSLADYTTGGIVSIANGASAVTGTGTTWTEKMAGRWLKITDSDIANTGDGEWYEISSIDSATTLTLDLLYSGTSISAGTAAYTIGQCSFFPESFQLLPLYKGLVTYFTSIKPDSTKSKLYNDMLVNGVSDMQTSDSKSSNPVLSTGLEECEVPNPNNYIVA